MVANGCAFTAARFSAEVAEELVKDPNDWVGAAAFQPPVEAREVEGGYKLTGQRALASFAHSARWIILTGLVMDGPAPRMVNGMPTLIVAIMNANWDLASGALLAEIADAHRGPVNHVTYSRDGAWLA
jgi:hypothetical protein